MKKIAGLLLVGIVVGFFSGCSINAIGQVDQPSIARPSTPITVYILDVFEIIDTMKTVQTEVKADSLLVAPLLPPGWSINSVLYSIDTAFYHHYAAAGVNGMSNLQSVIDSLTGIAGTATTRVTAYDAPLKTKYDTLQTNRSFFSFLGTKGFRIPAGTKMDTMIVNDTSTTVDTMYVKVVGCCLKISMNTGAALGSFKLGYFAGFDPNNIAASTINLTKIWNAFKDSNMITIANTAIRNEPYAQTAQALRLAVEVVPSEINLAWYLPSTEGSSLVSIHDMRGQLRYANSFGNCAGWNRRLLKPALPSGAYLLRLTAQDKTVAQVIRISR